PPGPSAPSGPPAAPGARPPPRAVRWPARARLAPAAIGVAALASGRGLSAAPVGAASTGRGSACFPRTGASPGRVVRIEVRCFVSPGARADHERRHQEELQSGHKEYGSLDHWAVLSGRTRRLPRAGRPRFGDGMLEGLRTRVQTRT